MNNDIININSKYQELHGYQEWYYCNKLGYRGNMKNGNEIGYGEFHGVRTIIFHII